MRRKLAKVKTCHEEDNAEVKLWEELSSDIKEGIGEENEEEKKENTL